MANEREKNSAKLKITGMDDLYHDIKQEKKKRLDDVEYEKLF